MRNSECGCTRYSNYKGKYYIAFYDATGENFIAIFDNIRQILQYKNIEITRMNKMSYAKYIYYAITRNNHYTRLLNGKRMTVRLIPVEECDI